MLGVESGRENTTQLNRGPKHLGPMQKRLWKREKKLFKLDQMFEKFTIEDINDMLSKVKDPSVGVEIKDRKHIGKWQQDVFLGKDLVTWLKRYGYAENQKHAIVLATSMLKQGYFTGLGAEEKSKSNNSRTRFKNTDKFYRFTSKVDLRITKYEDENAEQEWERRRSVEQDMPLVRKLISPKPKKKFDKLDNVIRSSNPEIQFRYFPLILAFLRSIAQSGAYSTAQFVKFIRTLTPLMHDRLIKQRLLLLLSNVEYLNFWRSTCLFHEDAYFQSGEKDQFSSLWDFKADETNAESENDEPDEVDWSQLSALEIATDIQKNLKRVIKAPESQERKIIPHIEGILLVDLIDLQTNELFLDRLKSANTLEPNTIVFQAGLQHPLVHNSVRRPTRVTVEKVFNSVARPALLSFKQLTNGNFLSESAWEEIFPRVIWKKGDNLNQDLGAEQCFQVFNILWASCTDLFPTVKERPFIHTYEIFPTGKDSEGIHTGFMEAVDNVEPFKSFSWQNWLKRSNPDMVNRLITSAAGAYVGGYVLGVRDRHWDNILIKNKDTLFHIDFGFLLGTQPPIDAPILSISSDMKVALVHLGVWDKFINLCLDAYQTLRRYSNEVIHAAKLIFSLALEWDTSAIETYMRKSLQLESSDKEAAESLRGLLEGSSLAWQNFFKQFSHKTIDPVWYGLLKRHFPPVVAIMSQIDGIKQAKVESKKSKHDLGDEGFSITPMTKLSLQDLEALNLATPRYKTQTPTSPRTSIASPRRHSAKLPFGEFSPTFSITSTKSSASASTGSSESSSQSSSTSIIEEEPRSLSCPEGKKHKKAKKDKKPKKPKKVKNTTTDKTDKLDVKESPKFVPIRKMTWSEPSHPTIYASTTTTTKTKKKKKRTKKKAYNTFTTTKTTNTNTKPKKTSNSLINLKKTPFPEK